MPTTRGGFGEKGQDDVSDEARARHSREFVRVSEPVSLGEVGAPVEKRGEQSGEVIGAHLVIAVHFDDEVGIETERLFESCDHGAADALIVLMVEDLQPRLFDFEIAEDLPGAVGARVVDGDDRGHPRRQRFDHRPNLSLDLVTGDHDCNGGGGRSHSEPLENGSV